MKIPMIILLASLIILPTSLISSSHAANSLVTTRIYLNPSSNTFYTNQTSIGDRFNITVMVENSPDIGAWQLYMEFNDTFINVTKWFEPTADSQYIFNGKTTSAVPTPPNPGYVHMGSGRARIQVAVSLFPTPPTQSPSSGSGKLCIIEFVITALPPDEESLSCILTINSAVTTLLDPDGNDVSGILKENGRYTLRPPPATPHIWLETSPTTVNLAVPKPFNLTVNVKGVQSTDYLIGIQFKMHYNSTYLNATNFYEGSFLQDWMWAPYSTFFTAFADIPHNNVLVGQLILPNDTGFWDMTQFAQGQGEVAAITFMPLLHEAIAFDLTPQALYNVTLINKRGEEIPYLDPVGSNYTYTPAAKPTLEVDPSTYTSSHLGELFVINVKIVDLVSQWKLRYLECEFKYDSAVMNLKSVTAGTFLTSFNGTFNYVVVGNSVKINSTLTPSSGYPSGAGNIATITFNATSRPPAESALTLNNVKMLDPDGYEILTETADGYYRMYETFTHNVVVGTTTYPVTTVSNAAVDPVPMKFDPYHRTLYFNVTGNGTPAFINVTIPTSLMYAIDDNWLVIAGNSIITPTITNGTASKKLTLNYDFTNEQVFIAGTSAIPEIPANAMALLFLIATAISIRLGSTLYKRRRNNSTK